VNDPVGRETLVPADVFQAPDLIEAVVGFRNWRVIDGRLRSVYLPVFWEERTVRAHCNANEEGEAAAHMAPDPTCTCGIYAYLEPDRRFPTIDYRGVTGIVTLSGTIEVHADGMRAEQACVEALAIYSRWTSRQKQAVEQIAGELGVDLVDLGAVEQASERYGQRLTADLLPQALPPEPALPSWLRRLASGGYSMPQHGQAA
jgi:hypothetical protein